MTVKGTTLSTKRTEGCLMNALFAAVLIQLVLGEERMDLCLVDCWNDLRGLEEFLQVDRGEVRDADCLYQPSFKERLHVCPCLGKVPILRMHLSVLFTKVRRARIIWWQRYWPVHQEQVSISIVCQLMSLATSVKVKRALIAGP